MGDNVENVMVSTLVEKAPAAYFVNGERLENTEIQEVSLYNVLCKAAPELLCTYLVFL